MAPTLSDSNPMHSEYMTSRDDTQVTSNGWDMSRACAHYFDRRQLWHLLVGHSTLILVSRCYDHYNLFVSWFTFPLKLNGKFGCPLACMIHD